MAVGGILLPIVTRSLRRFRFAFLPSFALGVCATLAVVLMIGCEPRPSDSSIDANAARPVPPLPATVRTDHAPPPRHTGP